MRFGTKRNRYVFLAVLGIGASVYAFGAALNGRDQKVHYVKEGVYPGFGYEWENNTLGMEPGVPAPFTPVEVNGETVYVWGREIVYGNGWFPRQILSQQIPLLKSPIRADVVINGESAALPAGSFVPERITEERAAGQQAASISGVSVSVEASVEFDGFIRTDLTLVPPESGADLDRLVLEIPLTADVGKYL